MFLLCTGQAVSLSALNWPCSVIKNMECPTSDEHREAGCQVKCGTSQCDIKAQRLCSNLIGCSEVHINKDQSWATLKKLERRRSGGELLTCVDVDERTDVPGCQIRCKSQSSKCARAVKICAALPNCTGINVTQSGGWALLTSARDSGHDNDWCVPTRKETEPCQRSSPFCIVLSPASKMNYSPKLLDSLPKDVPVVVGIRGLPDARQASINHFAFLVERYDTLPAILAFVSDSGDFPVKEGCNKCVQARELQSIHGQSDWLRNTTHLVKSLSLASPHPAQGGGGISVGCVSRPLEAAETVAWQQLAPWLGRPPERLHGYAGVNFLVSADRVRARPYALWTTMLRLLLRRDSGRSESVGSGLSSLLKGGLMSGLLGVTSDASFRCDMRNGWDEAKPRLSLPPPSAQLPQAEVGPQLQHAAPTKPNSAELASGCGKDVTLCIVTSAYEKDESPSWAKKVGLISCCLLLAACCLLLAACCLLLAAYCSLLSAYC